jgi:sigma-E factor negative regulatory protein RseC
MIEEKATVLEVDSGVAWVQTERRTACSSCTANKGCGTGVIAKVVGRRSAVVRAIDPVGVSPGELVIIGIAEDAIVRGSSAVYLVPLLAMFGAGIAGSAVFSRFAAAGSEWPGIVSALAGLAGGLWWLRRYASAVRNDTRFQPVVLRRETADMGTRNMSISLNVPDA